MIRGLSLKFKSNKCSQDRGSKKNLRMTSNLATTITISNTESSMTFMKMKMNKLKEEETNTSIRKIRLATKT